MKRPSTGTGSGRLRGSRPSSFKPETELEVFRDPGALVGELLHPDAEIAAQLVDLVAPDAFDRRRELFFVFLRHPVERRVEQSRRRRQRSQRNRQLAVAIASRAEIPPALCETGCRGSADPCAPAARARPRARGDESSPAGTDTGRRRSAAARRANRRAGPSRCAASAGAIAGRDLDQAVARRPRRAAARPAADHRSPQRLVQPKQVVRAPLHRRRIAGVEQRLQHREVVLEIVDRAVRIRRRRPREARAAFLRGIRPRARGDRARGR